MAASLNSPYSSYEERFQPLAYAKCKSADLTTFYKTPQDLENELHNLKAYQESRLKKIKIHLLNCGSLAKRKYYCKQCEAEGEAESLVGIEKIYQECGIRYCSKHKCVITRFARVLETLKAIKRFKGLKNLWHFSIGFKPIPQNKFVEEFGLIKLRQERIMNYFFSRLRKEGVNINSIKVLDFSFKKIENFIYMHWHFIALPYTTSLLSKILTSMQSIRKSMLKHQKQKNPFYLKSYGYKKKSNLFAYVSLRSVGCFKKTENKEKGYKIKTKRKLLELLQTGQFIFLRDIIDLETYSKYFYNKRYFSKVGKEIVLPQGSIIMDNLTNLKQVFCKKHGNLNIYDHLLVRWELELRKQPPPSLQTIKITTEKIAEAVCFCGLPLYKNGLCEFCYKTSTPEYKMLKLREKFNNFLQ